MASSVDVMYFTVVDVDYKSSGALDRLTDVMAAGYVIPCVR